MNKEQLFEKYNVKESHNVWDNNIDNWISVEIFRIMHDGRLPSEEDKSIKYLTDFLDKKNNDFNWWANTIMKRPDWGSLYLTAHRMIYKFQEAILTEINN